MLTFQPYENSSPEDMGRRQQRRLLRLLRHVYHHSPYYQRWFASQRITLRDLPALKLDDLPIIDKPTLMAHFDELVCTQDLRLTNLRAFLADPARVKDKYLGRYTVLHTSGTSGEIGVFPYEDRDLNWINILFLKYIYGLSAAHAMLGQRIAFAGMTGGHYAAYSMAARAREYQLAFMPISLQSPPAVQLRLLESFQPTIIIAYPGMLDRYAEAQMDGMLHIHPELVVTGAEPLHAQTRTRCMEAFGIAPREVYGASESLVIAADTCQGERYVFSDMNLVETPGGGGDQGALLTNLYNYALPIIRYRLDDVLRIRSGASDSPLPLPVLESICGRVEEQLEFHLPGRTVRLHPLLFVEFYVQGVDKLQVVRHSRLALTLRVVLQTGEDGQTLERIRAAMNAILAKQGLLDDVTYTIAIVDELPPSGPGGKFKLILDETSYGGRCSPGGSPRLLE